MNIGTDEAAAFLAELHRTAECGETAGLSLEEAEEEEILSGVIVNPDGLLEKEVKELLIDPQLEEILISHLTGLSIDELNALGGVPKPEKPFKTGFNA
jgi:hypothetical protein